MPLRFGSVSRLNKAVKPTRVPRGGGVFVPAPVIAFTSADSVSTPTATADLIAPQVGDVITWQRATDAGFTANVTTFTDTLDSTEVGNLQTTGFVFGTWADGTYYNRAKMTRGGIDSAWSAPVQKTIAAIVPSATYATGGSATGAAAVKTMTGASIGAAAANRVLVFAIYNLSSGMAVQSLSLVPKTGGTTHATVTATSIANNSGSSAPSVTWFVANVPDGTTADLTVTYPSNPFNNARFDLWRALDLSSSTVPVDVKDAFAASNTTASLNIATQSGGLVFAAALNLNTTGQSGGTPTGTETYTTDSAITSFAGMAGAAAHAAGVATNAASSVSTTFGAAGDIRLVALSLR